MSKKVRKVANKKMKNEPCLVGVGANTTYYVRVYVYELRRTSARNDDVIN